MKSKCISLENDLNVRNELLILYDDYFGKRRSVHFICLHNWLTSLRIHT